MAADALSEREWDRMNGHIRIYQLGRPMTRRKFLELPEDLRRVYVKLLRDKHGATRQQVRQMTGGAVTISAGTMYGTLSKMEKDGLIVFDREEDKRKLYRITELGIEVLNLEIKRIERLYKNSKGEEIHG